MESSPEVRHLCMEGKESSLIALLSRLLRGEEEEEELFLCCLLQWVLPGSVPRELTQA